jgi:hypothetical protein
MERCQIVEAGRFRGLMPETTVEFALQYPPSDRQTERRSVHSGWLSWESAEIPLRGRILRGLRCRQSSYNRRSLDDQFRLLHSPTAISGAVRLNDMMHSDRLVRSVKDVSDAC